MISKNIILNKQQKQKQKLKKRQKTTLLPQN